MWPAPPAQAERAASLAPVRPRPRAASLAPAHAARRASLAARTSCQPVSVSNNQQPPSFLTPLGLLRHAVRRRLSPSAQRARAGRSEALLGRGASRPGGRRQEECQVGAVRQRVGGQEAEDNRHRRCARCSSRGCAAHHGAARRGGRAAARPGIVSTGKAIRRRPSARADTPRRATSRAGSRGDASCGVPAIGEQDGLNFISLYDVALGNVAAKSA